MILSQWGGPNDILCRFGEVDSGVLKLSVGC